MTTQTTGLYLKPCPLCGGKSELQFWGGTNGRDRDAMYDVCCKKKSCGVWGPDRKTASMAAKAWNRRTA